MALHRIRIIEQGDFRTQRLFDLGLSFGLCRRKRHWPSLNTMNSFLRRGTDDGELATTIEWEPCELTQEEYERSVAAIMKAEPFKMDKADENWDDWIERVSHENNA